MKVQKIPQTLKDLGEFCCWKYEVKDGRKTKVPYNPVNGYGARTNDPSTFVPFDTAVNAPSYDGIGIRVSGAFVGIDLDHCMDDGNLLPWAKEITDRFADTYIEVSPSGEGARIFCLLPSDLNLCVQSRKGRWASSATHQNYIQLHRRVHLVGRSGRRKNGIAATKTTMPNFSREVNP